MFFVLHSYLQDIFELDDLYALTRMYKEMKTVHVLIKFLHHNKHGKYISEQTLKAFSLGTYLRRHGYWTDQYWHQRRYRYQECHEKPDHISYHLWYGNIFILVIMILIRTKTISSTPLPSSPCYPFLMGLSCGMEAVIWSRTHEGEEYDLLQMSVSSFPVLTSCVCKVPLPTVRFELEG